MATRAPDLSDTVVPSSPGAGSATRLQLQTQIQHFSPDRHAHAHERDATAETSSTHPTGNLPSQTVIGNAVPWTEKTNQQPKHQQQLLFTSMDDHFSQSDRDHRSADGSQESNTTSSSDQVFTPTASDASAGPSQDSHSQLRQLSAIAAAQDRMAIDLDEASPGYGPRKRMADGEVKSPVRTTHSRNTSTVSMASTTSTIGELSSELKTRLSYAMVKVNKGWQARSLDEVESLASQAASPTSSTSTAVHRRHDSSSASPQMAAATTAQVHFAGEQAGRRPKSDSPPTMENKPTLAPPAPIRPSAGPSATSGPNRRRNSNPRYTPTMLSHTHSASATRSTPQPPPLNTAQARQRGMSDHVVFSPHQNVREQDAIESLLFMSSPNNSANLKHSFSPAGSPGPASQPTPRSSAGRHALPSGPRKALPNQRPLPSKRVGFDDTSPGMASPNSPMDLDSPQGYLTPNRGTPRRRVNGTSSHLRSALSLPSALGLSSLSPRKPLSEKDIEKMLDREDRDNSSSDDEDIQLPSGRNGVAAGIL